MLTYLLDDFFVGIGDINSTFLPKVEPITVSTPPTSAQPAESVITPEVEPTPEEVERSEAEKKAMLSKNSETLNAQVKERPLAKMQEELKQSTTEESSPEAAPTTSKQEDESQEEKKEGSEADAPKKPAKIQKTPRKALLKNDDTELTRIDQVRLNDFQHNNLS